MAELVREQVLRRTREELPHAVEVEVSEMAEQEDGLLRDRGARLGRERVAEGDPDRLGRAAWCRAIGTAGPQADRDATGSRVHLDLRVRVRKGWRGDDALLDRLGIE